ncbi:DUF3169 family protein [Bacillus sp. DX4.1]|uniref:DUF3169 family protein n=1 Tax=Bacillus sp. DX4.1 TaxID=3055867 RepID=UPI0025A0A947|nr:DUF3169 family protein [Bacillus sp. DX4.1]MDM5190665.1 DUF3169 family protein [Bacillus sp. DX4.1]
MESRVKHTIFSLLKIFSGMVFGGVIGFILADAYVPGPRIVPGYLVIIALILLGVAIMYQIWKTTRMLTKLRDEEESAQGRRLGARLIYLRISEIIIPSWTVYAYIYCYRSYTAGTSLSFEVVNVIVSSICLIGVISLGFVMKSRYNTLYPEQSVTYSQSLEMWAKNADEGQTHIVHEAGYKAYQSTNTVLACVWFAAIAYTILGKNDFFLIGIITFVWILHIGKYMYEMHKKMIY